MAKMFYTLQEAAQKLRVDEQAVKEMTTKGQLQQFRDRDKLMFKRDQVDALASKSASAASSGGAIPLSESGDTDAIDLSAETNVTGSTHGQSGMNVFETGEVEAADSMAKTQVSSDSDENEINIESVGSGSGLLDLTQESDDTSLGAELLDEIYPGSDESQAGTESGVSGSAVFEGVNMESASGQSAGLTGLGEEQVIEPVGLPVSYGDASDPAGSGFGAGMLLGAIIVLVLALVVTVSAISSVHSALTASMAGSGMSLGIWCVGLLILSFILAFIGATIGKAAAH